MTDDPYAPPKTLADVADLGVPLAVVLAVEQALAAGARLANAERMGKLRWKAVILTRVPSEAHAALAAVGFRYWSEVSPSATHAGDPAHWSWRSWWAWSLRACHACGTAAVQMVYEDSVDGQRHRACCLAHLEP